VEKERTPRDGVAESALKLVPGDLRHGRPGTGRSETR
jgi:hypothetical protein